jgi:hypothetical protein
MQETAILLHRVGIGFVVLSIIDRCSVYETPENAQVDLREGTRVSKRVFLISAESHGLVRELRKTAPIRKKHTRLNPISSDTRLNTG